MDAHESEAGTMLLAGHMLCKKWRIQCLIGRGGMGAVYEATHRNGRRVAIKVLDSLLASKPGVRARFLQEGYLANKVNHAGAVAILDDDVDVGGAVFLVMELLEGETVAARMKKRDVPLSLGDALDIADGILDVLAAAHEQGLVHRDVKPENVFLTRDGTVKLLDFGIARLREPEAQRASSTRSGAALGTPGFMAPEQARGRWDLVDERTDVWALGALLYRLLTGQPVHRAETPNELLIAAATQPVASVAGFARDLSASVVDIVDRALQLERECRWPTARSMQAAIQRVRRELPAEEHERCPRATPARALDATLSETRTEGTGPSSAGCSIGATGVRQVASPRAAQRRDRRSLRTALGLAVASCIVAIVVLENAARNDDARSKLTSPADGAATQRPRSPAVVTTREPVQTIGTPETTMRSDQQSLLRTSAPPKMLEAEAGGVNVGRVRNRTNRAPLATEGATGGSEARSARAVTETSESVTGHEADPASAAAGADLLDVWE